jgi:hypothetical protein
VVAINLLSLVLFKSACRAQATVAGFNMRTWFNKLPHRPHAEATSNDREPVHAKERVPAPVIAVAPYALAKKRASASSFAPAGRRAP